MALTIPLPVPIQLLNNNTPYLAPGVAPAQTGATQNQTTIGPGGYFSFFGIQSPTAPSTIGPSSIPPTFSSSPSISTTTPSQPDNGIDPPLSDAPPVTGSEFLPVGQQNNGVDTSPSVVSGTGLAAGAKTSTTNATGSIITNQGQTTTVGCNIPQLAAPAETNLQNLSDTAGRRVRLRPKPGNNSGSVGGAASIYCCSPILTPLIATNGMIWPYQPLITYQQEVDYKSMELTHSNQDIYSYHRTPSVKLSVDGEFTVQNQQEGLYAMACIHYLRVVTKMYFGDNDPNAGTPPPVLLFDAYGAYMFNALPVIVTGFTVGLPKDVDYVPVDMEGIVEASDIQGDWQSLNSNYLNSYGVSNSGIAWLPAVFNIQVQLTIQNIPSRLRKFNLNGFRQGTLLTQGGWV